MNSDQIRKRFLDFFAARGHRVIPSAPLVPHGDPTLLFTSAGMVQFKPYFMGQAEPPSPRMASIQKCFRTSDIDEVGDDTHLTFFEMLGNFSVGDYFKKEAIEWAWELLTDPKEQIGLPKERLWVSVYLDDDEAAGHWRALGMPEERIMRYGEEENYWFSGDVGPCGPCSEIHYDFGPRPDCPECEAGTCHPAVECGRFTELWNLVFTMYFQNEDGTRIDLPQKNIDTGAGLERWASVLQGKRNVYQTDLFRPLIGLVESISGFGPERDDMKTGMTGEESETGLEVRRSKRIIAEHVRAATFLVADGVMPGKEGRGYVLRRILRRAVAYGRRLRLDRPFLTQIVGKVIDQYGGHYGELMQNRDFITNVVGAEEARFGSLLSDGVRVLQEQILPQRLEFLRKLGQPSQSVRKYLSLQGGLATKSLIASIHEATRVPNLPIIHSTALMRLARESLQEDPRMSLEEALRLPADALRSEVQKILEDIERAGRTLSGREVFVLYDTFGFPAELSEELAAEQRIGVDWQGFEKAMEEQRERARAAGRFRLSEADSAEAYAALSHLQPKFTGYETMSQETSVAGIIAGGSAVENVDAGTEAELVLFETPFYAEQGGQVGDTGEIRGPNGRFRVEDTQRTEAGLALHRGRVVEGQIAVNDDVLAQVDVDRRWDIMRNHTATHLLHAALRRILGPHARQSGSLVAPDRLRFDFTHVEALKPEEVADVERLVNEKIRENLPVHTERQSYEAATAGGATALFDEKYAAEVRVVEVVGDGQRYSAELCGGTHVHATGDIGAFIIVGEESIGAGLRRIEALTGRGADEYVRRRLGTLQQLRDRLGVSGDDSMLVGRVDALFEEVDSLKRRVQALEREMGRSNAESLLAEAERVDGRAVLAARVPASSPEALREMGDWLRGQLESAVIVLGTVVGGRPSLLAMVTPDLTSLGLNAGELVKRAAEVTGGGGGGRAEMAQAGGRDASRLDEALRVAKELATAKIRGSKG
jgi:alanyl-tRNA synthetase